MYIFQITIEKLTFENHYANVISGHIDEEKISIDGRPVISFIKLSRIESE